MTARRGREAKLFGLSTGLMHFTFLQILVGALVAGLWWAIALGIAWALLLGLGFGAWLRRLHAGHLAALSPAELESKFDLGYHFAQVDTIFSRVFGG